MLGVHERRICLISPGEREVCAAAAFAGLGWKAGSFVSRVVYTQAGQAGSLSLERMNGLRSLPWFVVTVDLCRVICKHLRLTYASDAWQALILTLFDVSIFFFRGLCSTVWVHSVGA